MLRVTNLGNKTIAAVDLNGKPAPHCRKSSIIKCWARPVNIDCLLDQMTQSSWPTYRNTERLFDMISPDGFAPSPDFYWYYRYTDNRILGYSIPTKRLALIGGPAGILPVSQPWPAPFVGRVRFRGGFYGASEDSRPALLSITMFTRLI